MTENEPFFNTEEKKRFQTNRRDYMISKTIRTTSRTDSAIVSSSHSTLQFWRWTNTSIPSGMTIFQKGEPSSSSTAPNYISLPLLFLTCSSNTSFTTASFPSARRPGAHAFGIGVSPSCGKSHSVCALYHSHFPPTRTSGDRMLASCWRTSISSESTRTSVS